MRIHLPVLKKINGRVAGLDTIPRLVEQLPGVTSFTPNVVSGNVLVTYDTAQSSQPLIISYIRTLTKTAVTYRKKIEDIDPDKMERVLASIGSHIASLDSSVLSQEKELELPDEIWT